MKKPSILSQYYQSPYILIGLESTDNSIVTLLNNNSSNQIKQIFNNINDCESFIKKSQENDKIVLIVSNHLSENESIKLQKYPQIDAIYSYYQHEDLNDEFICIYKKVEQGKFSKIFHALFENLWFLIGLIIVIIFAYLVPNIGASNGPLYTKYTVKIGCVFLIFLLSSLSLPLKNLAMDILNYRLHLCTQFYNLIFMPFVVFGIALLLDKASINEILITGMILMGCMPTANSINVSIFRNVFIEIYCFFY
jgi:predicted permease